ncbi:hypothetical protein EV714DRAFT_274929 [Schizophyllum commune]
MVFAGYGSIMVFAGYGSIIAFAGYGSIIALAGYGSIIALASYGSIMALAGFVSPCAAHVASHYSSPSVPLVTKKQDMRAERRRAAQNTLVSKDDSNPEVDVHPTPAPPAPRSPPTCETALGAASLIDLEGSPSSASFTSARTSSALPNASDHPTPAMRGRAPGSLWAWSCSLWAWTWSPRASTYTPEASACLARPARPPCAPRNSLRQREIPYASGNAESLLSEVGVFAILSACGWSSETKLASLGSEKPPT